MSRVVSMRLQDAQLTRLQRFARTLGKTPGEVSAMLIEEQLREAEGVTRGNRAGIDPYGFTLSFKGVFLEGLEVAFIVLGFASHPGGVALGAAAAAAALLVVGIAGVVLHAPLSRVPENLMKLGVGLMLTTFGTFWAAEGAGAEWPGGDLALLPLLALYVVLSYVLIRLARGSSTAAPEVQAA